MIAIRPIAQTTNPKTRLRPPPSTEAVPTSTLSVSMLVDVDDLDAAIDWARRTPVAEGMTVEVRAVAAGLPWQRVLTE
jgi:hypothetical protein